MSTLTFRALTIPPLSELACQCLTYTISVIDFAILHVYHHRLAGGARATFLQIGLLESSQRLGLSPASEY